jgi:hypothetical protein
MALRVIRPGSVVGEEGESVMGAHVKWREETLVHWVSSNPNSKYSHLQRFGSKGLVRAGGRQIKLLNATCFTSEPPSLLERKLRSKRG